MKKIIILIIVLIVGLIAFTAWRFFFAPAGEKAVTQEELERLRVAEDALLNEVLNKVLKTPQVITDNPVFGYWLNKKTNEVYYLTENGDIYKISSNGESQATGTHATGNLSYIKPSFDGSLLLVAFGYPQSPAFAIHDLAKKTWQALPAGTTAAAWDPASKNRLIYLKDSGDSSRLNFFNLVDRKSTELLRFSQKDFDLEWVLPDLVYLRERGTSEYPSSLWSFDLKKKTLSRVIKEETGLDVAWSNDGNYGIKLNSNGLLYSTTLIDKNNRLLADLPIITVPSLKCAFDKDKAYCAAPAALPPRIRLPDEYFKKSILFEDLIYKIDLTSGETELAQAVAADLEKLILDGNRLLFVNRRDQKIYSLEL